MSELSSSEQERLKQIERELEQASAGQGSPASAPQKNPVQSLMETWGRPLLTLFAILGCILLVGLFFRVFGTVLKLAVVVGLGYLLYVFVVAPRLGLRSGARPDQGDSDLDSF